MVTDWDVALARGSVLASASMWVSELELELDSAWGNTLVVA